MKPIVLELPKEDIALLKLAFVDYPDQIEILETRRLVGGDLASALVYLTSVTVPFVVKVIVELIRARKNVSIKVDGVEVSGLSERNALRIVTQLSKNSKHGDT